MICTRVEYCVSTCPPSVARVSEFVCGKRLPSEATDGSELLSVEPVNGKCTSARLVRGREYTYAERACVCAARRRRPEPGAAARYTAEPRNAHDPVGRHERRWCVTWIATAPLERGDVVANFLPVFTAAVKGRRPAVRQT